MLFVMVAQWNRMAALTADDYQRARRRSLSSVADAGGGDRASMLLPAIARRADRRGVRDPLLDVSRGQRRTVGLGRPGRRSAASTRTTIFPDAPLIVVGAGIAAGFAYWLVAGWSAGFWKPVFAQPQAADAPPPAVLPIRTENEIAGQKPGDSATAQSV